MNKKNLNILKARGLGVSTFTFSEAYDPYRINILLLISSLPSTSRTKTIQKALIIISKHFPDLTI